MEADSPQVRVVNSAVLSDGLALRNFGSTSTSIRVGAGRLGGE